MTYQSYGCGTQASDSFFKYGDGQFHDYVFTNDATGLARAYVDGNLAVQSKKQCSAAKFNGARDVHFIGGSACKDVHSVFTSHIELEWAGIWDKVPPTTPSSCHQWGGN